MQHETKRLEWIDIAKGIGITSILLGHLLIFYYDTISGLSRYLYIFHVPIFFFVSGFLFKKKPIKIFFERKTIELLVPYACAFIFVAFFNIIFLKSEFSFYSLFYVLITGISENLFFSVGPLWFIPCLFLTLFIYNLISNILSFKLLNYSIFIFFFIYVGVYSYFNIRNQIWSVNLIPITVFFVHMGFLYSKICSNKIINTLGSLLGIVALLSISYNPYNMLELHGGYLGIPYVTIFCSIWVIITIIAISKILSSFKISKIIAYIGRCSLTIMIFHMIIFLILEKYIQLTWSIPYKIIFFTILTIIGSLSLDLLLKQFKMTRLLFLGGRK